MSARVVVRKKALLIARACFVFIGAAPWLMPLLAAAVALGPLKTMLEMPFFFICHRLPARTIVLFGEAMPLCSRCSGIFTGLGLGALFCWPRLSLRHARIALAAGGLLMLGDVLTQDLGVHPVWHSTRLATGTLLGWLASAALMTAIIGEVEASRR